MQVGMSESMTIVTTKYMKNLKECSKRCGNNYADDGDDDDEADDEDDAFVDDDEVDVVVADAGLLGPATTALLELDEMVVELELDLELELEVEVEVVDTTELEVDVAELELTDVDEVMLGVKLALLETDADDSGSERDKAEVTEPSIDETPDTAVETGLSNEDSSPSKDMTSSTVMLYVVGTALLLTCNHGMV